MPDPLPVDFDPASEPGGGFSFKQLIPTIVFDVAMPIVTFNVLIHYGVSTLLALVAGGLFPAINNIRVWIKSRRLEPLGIIVITFLAIGTAASLISGSVFFTLIKESFLTATFGLICLGSLLAERPLMFIISRQFVAGDDPIRLEWWNGLWQYPQFRAAQRLVTAVWGVAYLVEALVRVGLAIYLSPAEVVAISPIMAFGVTIVLIAWTRRYMLAQRERRIRDQQVSQATLVASAFDKTHAIRSSCDRMAIREAQIDALATHLVNGLIDRGVIKPKADVKELIACVVELMSANFETEAQIDDEADKMAEAEARRDTRLDVTRLRGLIRQRLAEKKNFTL